MTSNQQVPAGRVRRNFAYLLIGEVANKGLRFVAAIVLARALTIEGFGLFNIAVALAGIAVIATSLGLPEVGARDVAVAPQRAGWIAGRVVTARGLAALAIGAGGLVVGLVAWPGQGLLLVPAALMALFMALSADWLARGLERMAVVAVASAMGGATVLAGSAAIALGHATPVAAMAVFAFGEGVAAVACWIALRRTARPHLGFDGLQALLRRSWPVAFSAVIVYGYYANADTLIIGATRTVAEAGLYSAPYRVFLALNVVAIFAAYATLPMLSRGAASGNEHVATAKLEHGLKLLAGCGLAVLGLVEIAGQSILGVLFGAQFKDAAPTFVLLCVAIPWYWVGYPAGYSLIARDANRRFLAGAAAAGGVNLALNLILIPPFGIIGAGIATLSSFVVAAWAWLIARGLLHRSMVLTVAGLSVATLGGVLAVAFDGARIGIGLATTVIAVAAAARLAMRPGG